MMNTPDTNLGMGAADDIWTSPLPADTKRMPQAVANPPMIATHAANWLCLAAAPTFAIMALLTGALGGGMPDMPCSAARDASALSGMIPMYLLMSVFHSAPWLELLFSGQRAANDEGHQGREER